MVRRTVSAYQLQSFEGSCALQYRHACAASRFIKHTENYVRSCAGTSLPRHLLVLLNIREHERDGAFQECLPVNAQVRAGMENAAIGVIAPPRTAGPGSLENPLPDLKAWPTPADQGAMQLTRGSRSHELRS